MILKKCFAIICVLIGTHQEMCAAEDDLLYDTPTKFEEPFRKFVELAVPFFEGQLDRSKYETLTMTGKNTNEVGRFFCKRYDRTGIMSPKLDQKFRENIDILFPTDLCAACRCANYFEKNSIASLNVDDFRYPFVWDSFRFTVMHKFLLGYLHDKMVDNWKKYLKSTPRPTYPRNLFDTAQPFSILTNLQTGFHPKEDVLYDFPIDDTKHILNKINVLLPGSELYYAFKFAKIIKDNPNKEAAIEAIRQFVLETQLAENNDGFFVIF